MAQHSKRLSELTAFELAQSLVDYLTARYNKDEDPNGLARAIILRDMLSHTTAVPIGYFPGRTYTIKAGAVNTDDLTQPASAKLPVSIAYTPENAYRLSQALEAAQDALVNIHTSNTKFSGRLLRVTGKHVVLSSSDVDGPVPLLRVSIDEIERVFVF